MNAQQLKKVTTYAGTFQIQLIHQRTGYFKHEVIIGGQPYSDPDQVIALIPTLSPREGTEAKK